VLKLEAGGGTSIIHSDNEILTSDH